MFSKNKRKEEDGRVSEIIRQAQATSFLKTRNGGIRLRV